ncbi:hypothetical protein JTB14_016891 [Gonioctena quinquepunctata]|nr:hypothetical protein JTB14_016891 [Gonioctena quinquepunctata]
MAFQLKNFIRPTVFIYRNQLRKLVPGNSTGIRTMGSEVEKALKAKHKKGTETIFDKIISKQIPADIIFEDDKCLAFNDVNPQAPVHFLVIPKKQITKLDDTNDDDKEILSHILLTAKTIAQKKLPNGYRRTSIEMATRIK